jgi:hypothetical protein
LPSADYTTRKTKDISHEPDSPEIEPPLVLSRARGVAIDIFVYSANVSSPISLKLLEISGVPSSAITEMALTGTQHHCACDGDCLINCVQCVSDLDRTLRSILFSSFANIRPRDPWLATESERQSSTNVQNEEPFHIRLQNEPAPADESGIFLANGL